MRPQCYKRANIFRFLVLAACWWLTAGVVCGQSTSQSFPTPITSNEISGTIKARAIGDPRLTSYFYLLGANQGDVFINVVTKNFNGDIDVFTADNLRPLTKIVIYADAGENETGRVIYLRQPQRLILRIEGRPPDDEPATYRIKFAGSFQPLSGVAETAEPELPEIKTEAQGESRVSSVGTILEVKPKPTPKPRAAVAQVEARRTAPPPKTADDEVKEEEKKVAVVEPPANVAPEPPSVEEKVAEKKEEEKNEKVDEPEVKTEKKVEVVVTGSLPPANEAPPAVEKTTESEETTAVEEKPKETAVKTSAVKEPARSDRPKAKAKSKESEAVQEPNPLANVRLVVLFKDGGRIERPLSEVTRFSVDKGFLTIVNKNGSTGRFSMLEIQKVTIE